MTWSLPFIVLDLLLLPGGAFDRRMAFVPEGRADSWLVSRRDSTTVARHEVPGSDAERPSSGRDG